MKESLRCFKRICDRAPTQIVTVQAGVIIRTCSQHLEAAEYVARNGRPLLGSK